MQLNSEQQQAVMHQNDPCLLLAGPGSGKTFTLIQRIEYLVQKCGVRPECILMLTFSKASALEMKERCMKQMGEHAEGVYFGTFHSFFFGILRDDGDYSASDVVKENEYLQFRERVRGEDAYQEWKKSEGKLDYTDMEKKCMELLTKEKEILEGIHKRYTYIMVDEFQDISEIQYQILRLLAAKKRNLFVVGDDDQSIYGFRGANPEIMLRLREDYPDIRILYLNTNYRCPEEIVRLSDRLIRHNVRRYPKKLCTAKEMHLSYSEKIHRRSELIQKQSVAVLRYANPIEECAEIATKIQSLHEEGVPWREIAVIARIREDLRRLRDTCIQRQIPVTFRDKTESIYDHFIFRDLWSYLQIAAGSRERRFFLRILNCPQRYLSSECLENETVSFDRMCSWFGFQKESRDTVLKLAEEVECLSEMTPYAALQYICRKMGYLAYLKEYAEERNISVKNLYTVLDEILERSKQYTAIDDWKMKQNTQHLQCSQEDGVPFLTMHGSKGLEFPYVFVMGVNEGNIPEGGIDGAEKMEEERRLFYVALTRTKCRAYLSYTDERSGKASRPSRFLSEMKIYSASE